MFAVLLSGEDGLFGSPFAGTPAHAWRPDPKTVTAGVIAWCFFSAVSFIASDDLIHERLYADLARWGLTNGLWFMVSSLDAIALLVSLHPRASLPFRSVVALVSALFWMFVGAQVFVTGVLFHVFPRSGMNDIFVGLLCGVVSVRWPYYSEPPNE